MKRAIRSVYGVLTIYLSKKRGCRILNINEIFYSIQGEGVYQGVPTVFIRLQGCNLQPGCTWCDTSYAQDPHAACKRLSVGDIAVEVLRLLPAGANRWVCITGGEPLLQEEALGRLVAALKLHECKVEIETNGTLLPPSWADIVTSWCADVKCPSSGIFETQDEWFAMRTCDQLKFVVQNDDDLFYVECQVAETHWDPAIVISPVLQVDASGNVILDQPWLHSVVLFCKQYGYRFSLQLHKLLWGNRIGV